MAGAAGAKRVVEREEARLGVFVRNAAAAALEPLAEHVRGGCVSLGLELDGERRPPAFAIGRLDGIGQARAQVAVEADSIHHDLEQGTARECRTVEVVNGDGPAVDEEPTESALDEAVDRR